MLILLKIAMTKPVLVEVDALPSSTGQFVVPCGPGEPPAYHLQTYAGDGPAYEVLRVRPPHGSERYPLVGVVRVA